jgi:hypothetical protein
MCSANDKRLELNRKPQRCCERNADNMKTETLSQGYVMACSVGLAICAAAPSQTNTRPSEATNSPGDLSYAAEKTFAAFNSAIMAGKEEKPVDDNLPEIPLQYWTEPIKALHPVKVYLHHYNLVVVQKISGEVEEGTCISSPISSYLPMSGDDGFIFPQTPRTETRTPSLRIEPSISSGQRSNQRRIDTPWDALQPPPGRPVLISTGLLPTSAR